MYLVPVVIDDHAFYRNCQTFAADPNGRRVNVAEALGECRCCAGARYVKGSRSGQIMACPLRCWENV